MSILACYFTMLLFWRIDIM